jgi:hypothetical protein
MPSGVAESGRRPPKGHYAGRCHLASGHRMAFSLAEGHAPQLVVIDRPSTSCLAAVQSDRHVDIDGVSVVDDRSPKR